MYLTVLRLSVFFTFTVMHSAGMLAQDKHDAATVDQLTKRIALLEAEVAQLKQTLLSDKLIQKLGGIWLQQSHIRSGQLVTPDDDVIWQLTPDEAYQWILSPEPPKWELGSMEIDASKTPAWVTFKLQINTSDETRTFALPGILKIENSTVQIALNETADCVPTENNFYPERPTSFESSQTNGVSLFVLKRHPNAR